MYASRGSMDLSKKDGGLPPDSVVQTVDEILRDCQRAVETYHDPSRFSMRMVALAPCSPFSVSEELLRQSAILARDLGVRLHDPPLRRRGRGALRPGAVRDAASGIHGIPWLDRPGRLVCPRHPFQRGGTAPSGGDRHRRCPLSHLQHEAQLRRVPGAGNAGIGRSRGPCGGRQRQQ